MAKHCLLVFLACLGLYVATAAPDLAPGHDSGELVAAACLPGVAHPPGYPLYTMLGWLASHLPVGSPAYRLNLFSCFLSALAAGLACLAFQRASGNRLAGLAAALAFGLAQTPWRQAVGAEKYSLHLVFLAALLALGADWLQLSPEQRSQRLKWLALTFGLALSHHHTIVLAVPGLALLLALHRPASWRGLAFLPLGLLPYLYLPWRAAQHPPLNWGDPSSLERFWWTLTRSGYGSLALNQASGSPAQQLGYYLQSLLTRQFPLLGLLALGAYRRGSLAASWGLHWLLMGPAFALYATQPAQEAFFDLSERFYASSYLAFAGLMALGAPARSAVFVPLALLLGALHYPACSLRGQYQPSDLMEAVLDRIPPGSVYLPGSDLSSGGALYYQQILGRYPDVQVLFPGLLGSAWYRAQHPDLPASDLRGCCLAWRAQGKEVFFDSVIPTLEGFFVPHGVSYRYLAPGEPLPDRIATEQANLAYLDSRAHRGDFFYRPEQSYWQHDCLARWAQAYRSAAESLHDPAVLQKARALEAP